MIELLLAGERMLAAGDLDHAQRLFSQVAEADPRNAIAVVGLAEVAAARGEEVAAIATARRALEIDPENAAATRMIDRLEAAIEPATEAGTAIEMEPVLAPEPTPVGVEPAPTTRSWRDRLLGFLRRH